MVSGKSKVKVDEVVLEFQIEKRIEESKAAQTSLDDGSGDEDLPVMGNVEATTRKEHHRMANETPEASNYVGSCGAKYTVWIGRQRRKENKRGGKEKRWTGE